MEHSFIYSFILPSFLSSFHSFIHSFMHSFIYLIIYFVVFLEFTKILLLSETYRRPIGDRHAWSETHWRPTCLIGDQSETDMPDRRPIGDRHSLLETDMPAESNWNSHLFKFTYFYIICAYLHWNNVRTLIRHVNLQWAFNYACRSPMCLLLGMYVGLRSGMSVSDQSPIKHVKVFDGSPIRHMLVSDGSPIRLR